MFLVIPALDIKDRKCVQLQGGDPDKRLVEISNPVDVALKWQSLGAKRLHLIDLDMAIHERDVNQELVAEIIRRLDIPVQYGGGIRSYSQAAEILNLGAEKVIIGTLALSKPEVVERLAEDFGKSRIVVAIDSKDGYVVVKGWQEKTRFRASEIAQRFTEYADEFLFTNVNVEGRLSGIDAEVVEEVVQACEGRVIVSGGISSLSDIERIKSMGARGVVIGSALYTGKIDFAEAIKLQD